MRTAEIYLEYPNSALDQTFTYLCGELAVQPGTRVRVPFGSHEAIGFVERIAEIADLAAFEREKGYALKQITGLVDEQPLLDSELLELGKWLAKDTVTPVIACYQAMLPHLLKPQSNSGKAAMVSYLHYLDTPSGLTERQAALLGQIKDQDQLKRDMTAISRSIVNRLLALGAISEILKERTALRRAGGGQKPLDLTGEQKAAMDQIRRGTAGQVFLLRGVTGSGKTEIYLQLAAEYLAIGKQVLILVPEISLTPQMNKRVIDRFSETVAIYHSGLSEQEKYEQYRAVQQRRVNIVVGTRSAVFMPFSDLGLIVIDEEHDHSYKQDSAPRYHCRDVALWRAGYHRAKVILGSATPSLESYARAQKKVYELVELRRRIAGSLAKTHIVDMNRELRKGNELISGMLRELISDRLGRQEQTIILLNRRGYSPVLRCANCGTVIHCDHCDVAMCYHKKENVLKCHICGAVKPVEQVCPKCGGTVWRPLGTGTEKLAEALGSYFPQARIARLDADVASRKGMHGRVLGAFAKGEYDILVGTQMIAKGLDFPNVTLVGILNADALLNRLDFRSGEITFDLLVQASGRSGRSEKGGDVVIQVYDPGHYAIRCAASQNYPYFFSQEMRYRHIGHYPPYEYFAAFIAQDRDEEKAFSEISKVRDRLTAAGEADILGPLELTKHQDQYRFRLLLRSHDLEHLKEQCRMIYAKRRTNKDRVSLITDINPLGMDE